MDATFKIEPTTPVEGLEVGRTELAVRVLGTADERVYPLPFGESFFIGSGPEANLVLDDRTVSRAHLEIIVERGRVRAIDKDSTNGSTFEGSRFRELIVYPGSVIGVGKSEVQVLAVHEETPLQPSTEESFGPVLGRSLKMRMVFALLQRASQVDATVLLHGETGTGKEIVAEALHQASPRADGPFIVVDCASIPRNLIESELFGHVKGAFTHAMDHRVGAFEAAHGGTIFLDEIGELPIDMQPRLLRVLETKTTKRVGNNQYRKIDVRVIAATNRTLEAEVQARRFRSDLFFRLAVIPIVLPPLRERREDIPMLVRAFIQEFAPDRAEADVPPTAFAHLMSQQWRGNVRELRNVVQKAMVGSQEMLSIALSLRRATDLSESELKDVAGLGLEVFFDLPYKDAKRLVLETFERAYIKHALAKNEGNIGKAAQKVGLHRNMVSRLLQREGLDPKQLRESDS